MKTDQIELVLREYGIKPSHHRMQIYKYLIEKRNHPSIEMVYEELCKEIPTLSRTTLYNTLELFADRGLVQMLTISEHDRRYDGDISPHGHFLCTSCKVIYDFQLNPESLAMDGLEGFEIHETQLYCRGICHSCLNQKA